MSRNRSSSSASIIKFFADRVSLFSNSDDNKSSSSLPTVVNEPNSNTTTTSSTDDEPPVEELPLPDAGLFTFDSIISTIKPEYDAATNSLQHILSQYKTDLTEELDDATEKQLQLTQDMSNVDQLAQQTLKRSQHKLSKANHSVQILERARIDKLAHLATQAYESLSTITQLLHEIDDLLPVDDKLATVGSLHKNHYPELHSLLVNNPVPGNNDNNADNNNNDPIVFTPPLAQPKPRRAVSLSALRNSPTHTHTHSTPVHSSIDESSAYTSISTTAISIPRSESTKPSIQLRSSLHLPENYPRSLLKSAQSPTPAGPVETAANPNSNNDDGDGDNYNLRPNSVMSAPESAAKDRLRSLIDH